MYPHIVCTCGRDIGCLYNVFKAMRADVYSAALNGFDDDIDPALLCLSEAVEIELADVFDQLRIYMICCRKLLLTQVEFNSIY